MKPWVCEYWNSFSRKRVDLYGCIDILAIGNGETWAVQTTSTNVSSRIQKIRASEFFPTMLESGWRVFVHGWRKNSKGRYVQRVVELTSTENIE
jgi:carbonic anhydrase